jgi:hypothetical protein
MTRLLKTDLAEVVADASVLAWRDSRGGLHVASGQPCRQEGRERLVRDWSRDDLFKHDGDVVAARLADLAESCRSCRRSSALNAWRFRRDSAELDTLVSVLEMLEEDEALLARTWAPEALGVLWARCVDGAAYLESLNTAQDERVRRAYEDTAAAYLDLADRAAARTREPLVAAELLRSAGLRRPGVSGECLVRVRPEAHQGQQVAATLVFGDELKAFGDEVVMVVPAVLAMSLGCERADVSELTEAGLETALRLARDGCDLEEAAVLARALEE